MGRDALPALWVEEVGEEVFGFCVVGRGGGGPGVHGEAAVVRAVRDGETAFALRGLGGDASPYPALIAFQQD